MENYVCSDFFQGFFSSFKVRPSQVTRAELDAAPVAGDRDEDIGELPLAQEVQNGQPACPARFAVIGHPFDDRVALDAEGEDDMTRFSVALLHVLHECPCGYLIINSRDSTIKCRFHDLDAGAGCYIGVFIVHILLSRRDAKKKNENSIIPIVILHDLYPLLLI